MGDRYEAYGWDRDAQKQIYLGGFSTPEDGATAHDLFMLKIKVRESYYWCAPLNSSNRQNLFVYRYTYKVTK